MKMLFRFNVNNQNIEDADDYMDYVEVSVRVDVTRKGYNAHSKDGKKKTLARNRARNAKFARRPQ